MSLPLIPAESCLAAVTNDERQLRRGLEENSVETC